MLLMITTSAGKPVFFYNRVYRAVNYTALNGMQTRSIATRILSVRLSVRTSVCRTQRGKTLYPMLEVEPTGQHGSTTTGID